MALSRLATEPPNGPVISDEQRRWRLAARHRLTLNGRTDDVVQIVNDLVALHSSDPATVYLSTAARMQSPSIDTVEHALYTDRSLIRHHAMRRTLWVMAPDVARLAHAAATQKIARAERKRTEAAFAATTNVADPGRWLDDATAEVLALLAADGPLSTREIGNALPHLLMPVTFGVNTKSPAPLNAHTKVLQGAGFNSDIVRGPPTGSWNSAEYTWLGTQDWLGGPIHGLESQSAAAELLRRWLLRFGPATMTDIRWWFGWTAGMSKRALADIDAVSVELANGEAGYVVATDLEPSHDPGPWVQLLPGLDPTAMGWKQRDWYLDPTLVAHLFDRFGNAGPTVWVDGQIVGGWIQRPSGEITVDIPSGLSAAHQRLLSDEIARVEATVGDVIVRPRFPAPVQRALLDN